MVDSRSRLPWRLAGCTPWIGLNSGFHIVSQFIHVGGPFHILNPKFVILSRTFHCVSQFTHVHGGFHIPNSKFVILSRLFHSVSQFIHVRDGFHIQNPKFVVDRFIQGMVIKVGVEVVLGQGLRPSFCIHAYCDVA